MDVYAKAAISGDYFSLKKEGDEYFWIDVKDKDGIVPSFYLLVGISYEYIFNFKPHVPYRWYHKYKYLSYLIEGVMLTPFIPLLIVLIVCYIKNIKCLKKVKDDLQDLFKMLTKIVR